MTYISSNVLLCKCISSQVNERNWYFKDFCPLFPILLLFQVVFKFIYIYFFKKIGDGKASSKATTVYQWRNRTQVGGDGGN